MYNPKIPKRKTGNPTSKKVSAIEENRNPSPIAMVYQPKNIIRKAREILWFLKNLLFNVLISYKKYKQVM
jgi:hypothetical protein